MDVSASPPRQASVVHDIMRYKAKALVRMPPWSNALINLIVMKCYTTICVHFFHLQ